MSYFRYVCRSSDKLTQYILFSDRSLCRRAKGHSWNINRYIRLPAGRSAFLKFLHLLLYEKTPCSRAETTTNDNERRRKRSNNENKHKKESGRHSVTLIRREKNGDETFSSYFHSVSFSLNSFSFLSLFFHLLRFLSKNSNLLHVASMFMFHSTFSFELLQLPQKRFTTGRRDMMKIVRTSPPFRFLYSHSITIIIAKCNLILLSPNLHLSFYSQKKWSKIGIISLSKSQQSFISTLLGIP